MPPDELNKKAELLLSKLGELKERISELRKQGKDPLIPDLLLRNIKARIGVAKALERPEDLDSIDESLEKARKEILEVETEKAIDIKRDVEEMWKKEKDLLKQESKNT
jgi:hypothetical protein